MATETLADLTRQGKFVFRGAIEPQRDPVNILFHGGTDSTGGSCAGSARRSPACTLQHLKLEWKASRMTERSCSGSPARARLTFYQQSGGTASPAAIWHTTTSSTCKRQYHYRNWTDTAHGHSSDQHQFGVGAVHHENRPALRGGHDIDMHWETVEAVMIKQMGSSQDGEPAHCTYPDYYRLPGSGNAKGKKSDGKISRISFHHIQDGGCQGQ